MYISIYAYIRFICIARFGIYHSLSMLITYEYVLYHLIYIHYLSTGGLAQPGFAIFAHTHLLRLALQGLEAVAALAF